MLELLLVDDDAFVRHALRHLLEIAYPGAILTEAETWEGAVSILETRPLSVVLLDLALGKKSGLSLLQHMSANSLRVPVLVLSSQNERNAAITALRSGAQGFISKDDAASPGRLKEAIDKILSGRTYVGDSLASQLIVEYEDHTKPTISAQESRVLAYIATGLPIKQIAFRMQVSEKTIRTYRSRLSQKLNLKTTADLIRYALEHGIS